MTAASHQEQLPRRRPTLALARSPYLWEEDEMYWLGRLTAADFNVLRVAYVASRSEKLSMVEASIGVVLVNSSAQDPRRGLPADGLALAARTAHGLDIPVYLTGEPSEAQQRLAPFTVLPDDLGVISRQWPPELKQPTTGEIAAISASAEALK